MKNKTYSVMVALEYFRGSPSHCATLGHGLVGRLDPAESKICYLHLPIASHQLLFQKKE